jgi:hypothetical protein
LFTEGFINYAINNADPVVMSNFILVMNVKRGLALLDAVTTMYGIK